MLAHNENYYAIHELAVLLDESGHYGRAHDLLAHLTATQKHPVFFRNLARVQSKLGMHQQATATRQIADHLAGNGTYQANRQVHWVPPAEFRHSRGPVNYASPGNGNSGNLVLRPEHNRRTAYGPGGRTAATNTSPPQWR